MERKLTAILSADVEGYSRLMGEDEEATIRTLTSYREVMTPLIRVHRGRVVDSPGDNLLAEFGSVVDAVKCAAIIQTTLRMENADLPQNRRMEFRIGINLGDVMVEGERIYGDGVNIAARVEGLAEAGGICISGTVFDQIKGKVSVNFEDLGPQQVKNIAEPIRAYRAVLGSGPESARRQQNIEVPRQDLRETSNLYKTLTSRLNPLLYRGIEDVLQRSKKTLKSAGDLNFVVVAPINGFYRSVGGTGPAEAPERQNSTKVGDLPQDLPDQTSFLSLAHAAIVMSAAEKNPYEGVPSMVAHRREGTMLPMFALSEPGVLENAFRDGGFPDVAVHTVDKQHRFPPSAEVIRRLKDSRLSEPIAKLPDAERPNGWEFPGEVLIGVGTK